jgi:hypothetical protein
LIRRAVAVWLVLILVETVHGILRGIFLVPLVGDVHARQIGVGIGSALIVAVAYIFSPWLGAGSRRALIATGVLWVVLTLAFEIALGRFIISASWDRILSDYDLRQGGLMILGMLVLGTSPLIAARMRGAHGRS